MSKIALVIRDFGSSKTNVISTIRQHAGLSISLIIRSIEEGFPILEKKLFQHDHGDLAKALTSLLDNLHASDAEFVIFQLSDNETYSADKAHLYTIVSEEKLRSVLASHNRELQRQHDLTFQEAYLKPTSDKS